MRIHGALHQILSVLPTSIILLSKTVFGKTCGSVPCPTVQLPWGTWEANEYNPHHQFFTFRNIRYGQPPLGNLRFAKSLSPDPVKNPTKLVDNTHGPSCIQIDPEELKKAVGAPRFGLGDGTPYRETNPDQSEDCLFLDVYVPKSAMDAAGQKKHNVPVVVWFYGGAFIFGSKGVPETKGLLYSGQSFIELANHFKEPVIFVVGNYRLGAFGWLAGSYMEANGAPNAGLTDQQLLLQWVNKYISKFGGDNSQVSAWGESAGGGSIVHHLVANGGKTDPLFSKVVLQSAAYFWAWDRTANGRLDQVYQEFAKQANCTSLDIDCLRANSTDTDTLIKANFNVAVTYGKEHLSPYGPAVDGTLIQRLPAVEFDSGNYWKGISSLMLSHVVLESNSFVPNLTSRPEFNRYIDKVFTGQPAVANKIETAHLYESDGYPERIYNVARDAFFTGNILQLYNAYQSTGKVYVAKYGWPSEGLSRHAYDLLPMFYYPDFRDIVSLIQKLANISKGKAEGLVFILKPFSPRYKQYFVSHAIKGDPNAFKTETYRPHYQWNPASYKQNTLADVAYAHQKTLLWNCVEGCLNSINSDILTSDRYDLWLDIAKTLTPPSPPSTKHMSEPQGPLGFEDELK